ncbi:MAG: hypothetical protein RLZZ609_2761 [Cyanobacteriota bacterium]|jgi:hypothetical protein
MACTKAFCNECSGETNHEVLHSEKSRWEDDAQVVYGLNEFDMLKCSGCNSIKLRHTSFFSEAEEETVNYFPPAIFRRTPEWFNQLSLELPKDSESIEMLLKEIYVALQNNLPSLAAMGVRSLLEKVMVSKVGDRGSFVKNLETFEADGYISRIQCERLKTILEAGHAVTHRMFVPTKRDLITLVDLAEHILETVYLHEGKIDDLKKRIPLRPARL